MPKKLKIETFEDAARTGAEFAERQAAYNKLVAEKNTALADVGRRFDDLIAAESSAMLDRAGALEEWAGARRKEFFAQSKTLDLGPVFLSFRLKPPSVGKLRGREKVCDIARRLLKFPWGSKYVRTAEPTIDKEALLADRDNLSAQQLIDAGLRFAQDEEFKIEVKGEERHAQGVTVTG
jgi:phage host-nuclease inhibitor protein Gam